MLAMLLVVFLNMRVLFCNQNGDLNTEFNVYDALVGIKNQLLSSAQITTTLSTHIEADGKTKIIKGNVYEREFDRVMGAFKSSAAWNETNIQYLINLLDMDMGLVKMLIDGKQNSEMVANIQQRDEMVHRAAPTIARVYNCIMDVATYDAKLEPQVGKNKKGETVTYSGYLTSREKKRYLHNIEKSLRSTARNLAMEQERMSLVSVVKHSSLVKRAMNQTAQQAKKTLSTAVDAQDIVVKSGKKMKKQTKSLKVTKGQLNIK